MNIINEKGSFFIKNFIGKFVLFEFSKLKGIGLILGFYDRVEKQVLLKFIFKKIFSFFKLFVLYILELNVIEKQIKNF